MDHSLHHQAHLLIGAPVDPLLWVGFVAVLSFSFLASLHCVVMCAPLVCAFSARSPARRWNLWLYNCGRAVSYTLSGALLGAFGGALLGVSAGLGKALAVALAFGLLLAAWAVFRGRTPGAGVVRRLTLPLGCRLQKLPPPLAHAGLGFITVLLPCMTLTPVLGLAAASGSALAGAALLLAFQLGTLPAMLIAPAVPHRLSALAKTAKSGKIAAIFLLLAAAVTLARVWHSG